MKDVSDHELLEWKLGYKNTGHGHVLMLSLSSGVRLTIQLPNDAAIELSEALDAQVRLLNQLKPH